MHQNPEVNNIQNKLGFFYDCVAMVKIEISDSPTCLVDLISCEEQAVKQAVLTTLLMMMIAIKKE